MRIDRLIYITLYVTLSACGGGGGGGSVNSTPAAPITPTPAEPVPTPSQNTSYSVSAGSSSVVLASDSNVAQTASATRKSLTISFDAAANRYTVVLDGRTTSFGSADATVNTADTVYQIGDGLTKDWLTVQKTPYSRFPARTNVNLAFVQRNQRTADRLNLDVAFFVYGSPTVASQMPLTGTLEYEADGIGLITAPGKQPLAFRIEGGISFDFGSGDFKALLPIEGYPLSGLSSSDGGSGGGYEISAAGKIAAGTALFSGTFNIAGFIAAVPGTLSGGFFGSNSTELGATLFGQAADGSTVSGAFTGRKYESTTAPVVTLANIPPDHSFYALSTGAVSSFRKNRDSSLMAVPSTSDLLGVSFFSGDEVGSPNPNFVAYAKTVDGAQSTLKLYKIGSANNELALNYVSFGEWTLKRQTGGGPQDIRDFFAYGLNSRNIDFQVRTGSARYEGLVYGAASNAALNGKYDVGGTSFFNVDFGADTMSGGLALQAIPLQGSPALALGSYAFSGPVRYWGAGRQEAQFDTADIGGSMSWNFYGPTASEVGGSFQIVKNNDPAAGQTIISGITIAKEK